MHVRWGRRVAVAALTASVSLVSLPVDAGAAIADDYTTTVLTPPKGPTEFRDIPLRGGISETGYVFQAYETFDDEYEFTAITGTPDAPVLTSIPSRSNTIAARPNASGQALFAYTETLEGGPAHLVVIDADGTQTERATSPSGILTAGGIDDDGTLVYMTAPCGDPSCAEVLKQPPSGPATVLASGLDALLTTPVGIRNGWIHGFRIGPDFSSVMPVRWDPTGAVTDVEVEGAAIAVTLDINSSGQMAGSITASVDPPSGSRPVRWEADGSITELDLLDAAAGEAVGIADDGTVTGVLYGGLLGGEPRPVAWQPDGTPVDLSSMLPANATMERSAVDVNTAGQILVTYTDSDIARTAAVLEPVPTLDSIAVTPASPSVPFGGSVALTATATFSDATTEDVTGTAAWSSSNPAVATVDSSGLVTAVGVGQATITASVDDVSGTSTVTVVPAATTLDATAIRTGGLSATITYTGTLTSATVGPLAGQSIGFASGSSAACTAVTNASGTATCSVTYGTLATLLGLLFPGTPLTPPAVGAAFTATYAGSATHLGSQDAGTIG